MIDSKSREKEVNSQGVIVVVEDKQQDKCELQPVQAFEDSPACPARSVATLMLRDTSPVHVEVGSTEQDEPKTLREWWFEQHLAIMAMRNPLEPDDCALLAGDERFTLWRTDLAKMSRYAPWCNARLYLLGGKQEYPKRVWRINFNPETKVIRDTGDLAKLEEHLPEMAKWVRAVLLQGATSDPPRVVVPTRRSWLKTRKTKVPRKTPAEKKARRKQYEAGKYQSKATARREKQETLANQVTAEMAEVFLVAIQMMWEAKTPCSIRRQAGMKRFAPAIFAEGSGLLEEVIEAWIKRMIAEGRIAEEMSCRKMRQKGLKVLQKKVEREEEGVSSSEGKAGGIKANG